MITLVRRYGLLMAICLIAGMVRTQENAGSIEDNGISIGKSYHLHSTILGEERPYLVYLPENYDSEGDPLVVMYLMDGQGHFHHTTGIVSFLRRQGRIPNMMVVAVPNTSDRTRDLTPAIELDSSAKTGFPTAGGADQTLAFLRDELIPHIDSNYHTSAFRLLVGHSFGGIFSVNALMKEPELFNAHISISPSMWWDSQNLVQKADKFLDSRDSLDVFYYMTMGNEGGAMLGGAMKLAALLEEKSPKGFEWDFKVLEEETHGSIPHRSTYNGLEAIFKDWHQADLADIYLTGGMKAIDNHFNSLSRKFGFDMHPSESQINQLGYDFMGRGAYGTALEIFLENVNRFPKSANVYDSAAEAYMEMGEKDKSIEWYKKSLTLNPGNTNGVAMLKKMGVDYDPMTNEIRLDDDQKQEIVGNYIASEVGPVNVKLEEGNLTLEAEGLQIQTLHGFAEGLFIMTPANIPLRIIRENDKIIALEVEVAIGQKVRVVRK